MPPYLHGSSAYYHNDTAEAFEDREERYLTYVSTRYPLNVPSIQQQVPPAVRAADCLRIIQDVGRAVRVLAPSGLVHFATTQVDRALDCPSIAVNLLRHISMHTKFLYDTATSASDAMREADPHCSELDKARVPLARCLLLKMIFDDIFDKCGDDSFFHLRLARARQRQALLYQVGRNILLAAVDFH
ncbi:hypothetical protein BDZ89DRAFT_1143460 [Hymenopellis radicata]|nr:hypothetical protein BDZ89DRAFT_1143460 [Hymenopellis radicata]